MIWRVLGIDIASSEWTSIGSATIDFDDDLRAFTSVIPHVIPWPHRQLTPDSMADAIDAFVRDYGVSAVALDGPRGWRDPNTSVGKPGVGRRCEYYSRTPSKTGNYPKTYPSNQRTWIEFSIEVFAKLLSKPGVELADSESWKPSALYGVLECFPTSAWRTSGLSPLPGKSRRPQLDLFVEAIRQHTSFQVSRPCPTTTSKPLSQRWQRRALLEGPWFHFRWDSPTGWFPTSAISVESKDLYHAG